MISTYNPNEFRGLNDFCNARAILVILFRRNIQNVRNRIPRARIATLLASRLLHSKQLKYRRKIIDRVVAG
jgi:hypothetical protein